MLVLYIPNWEKWEKTCLAGLFLNQIIKPYGWSKVHFDWLDLCKIATEVAVSVRGIFKKLATLTELKVPFKQIIPDNIIFM